jgi:alanyl-tRNA synthetase
MPDFFPGETVFKLMDSQGLPFDVICEVLAERGLQFDIVGFVRAARNSKNFSSERIYKVLTSDPNTPPEIVRMSYHVVFGVYEEGLPAKKQKSDPFLPQNLKLALE